MQNVAARKPDAAAPGWRRARIIALKAAHMMRRIAGPALPADIVVETAVAVGADIKPGDFLIAQIARQRVDILLAVATIDHRVEEDTSAKILGIPARPRQRAGDRGRQHDVLGCPIHLESLPRLKQPPRPIVSVYAPPSATCSKKPWLQLAALVVTRMTIQPCALIQVKTALRILRNPEY